MREPPRIAEEDLRACLQDQYDLSPVTLTFLPLGHDYDAGVYRAVSEQGTAYLLKVTSRPLYEPRCLVPRYLYDQGITSVVAPIPTSSGALWTVLSDWTVIVYPWICGETSLTRMTDEQWKQVGTIFQRIHQVMLAPKERDFIFVRHPHAEAFFQGYGQAEIDWVALTYYLWERVVQDLIECTQNVCFRDDWGEESRAEAVQLLHVILAEEMGHIDAAYQASAHLPRDLTVHSRKSS